MKIKKQQNKFVSFRISAETRKQLSRLMKFWNENQSETIQRCIERTAQNIERDVASCADFDAICEYREKSRSSEK